MSVSYKRASLLRLINIVIVKRFIAQAMCFSDEKYFV
jgi:hypothetical protein